MARRHAEIRPSVVGKLPPEARSAARVTSAMEAAMLWLLYVAWLTDMVGLVPKARPEARLLIIAEQRRPRRPKALR